MLVLTPNDPKLSDSQIWRVGCMVGERWRQEAASVTAGRVRCRECQASWFPSLCNCSLQHGLRVVPKLGQSSAKDLDVPPRTGRIAARCIRVALVLKLQMKTEPVHLLEHIELGCVNRDWLSASLAKFLIGIHERCVMAPTVLERRTGEV